MIGYDQIDAAAQRNPALRALLKRLIDQANLNANNSGIDSVAGQQTTRTQRIHIPQLAQMEVTGDDGHFFITIANPLAADGILLHEIQSSSTLPFSTSLDLATYGPAPATYRTVNQPNSVLYWRWRTRYQNSEFNRWQQLPQAVDSGAVRTMALATLLTRQTISPSPLVQNGTTLTISVLAFTMRVGEMLVSYDAGSVVVPAYDNYYVYFQDPHKNGGAVTYLATTDPRTASNDDGNVIVGSIALSSVGGAMGVDFTRPWQSCCVTGATVITLHSGATKLASAVVAGDVLLGIDGGQETVVRVESLPTRPVWTLVTQNGKTLQGGASHHMLYAGQGGTPVPVGMLNLGDPVLTRNGAENVVDYVVTKTLVGPDTIYRIVTNRTKTYLADDFWSRDFGGGLLV